jgi:hypothetical protein
MIYVHIFEPCQLDPKLLIATVVNTDLGLI